MEVKTINGEIEIIIEPDDREFMTVVDDRLKKITRDEKELIKSIIEKNLQYDKSARLTNVYSNIRTGLKVILDEQSADFVLNYIINPSFIKTVMDKLINEGIISQNTSKFIIELTAEYGGFLNGLIRDSYNREEWNGLNSNVLITDDELMLQTEIYRKDGEILRGCLKIS